MALGILNSKEIKSNFNLKMSNFKYGFYQLLNVFRKLYIVTYILRCKFYTAEKNNEQLKCHRRNPFMFVSGVANVGGGCAVMRYLLERQHMGGGFRSKTIVNRRKGLETH